MKNVKEIFASCVLFSGCLFYQPVHGVLVVNETFDYGGADQTVMPGSWEDGTSNVEYASGITANWAGDSDYVLSGAGGSLNARGLSDYRGAQLDLGTSLTGTFWTSVLIREDAASSSTAGALVAFETGDYFYANFDGFAFGINGDSNLMTAPNSSGSTTEESGPVALPSGFGLYIAKISVNAGGANDAIDLWTFGSGDSFGQTEASLGTAVFSSTSVQYGDSISDVWLGAKKDGPNDINGPAYFDNLRISNLSGDNGLSEVLTGTVIPEPSSFLLCSLALVLIAGCRFRK